MAIIQHRPPLVARKVERSRNLSNTLPPTKVACVNKKKENEHHLYKYLSAMEFKGLKISRKTRVCEVNFLRERLEEIVLLEESCLLSNTY